ncbi:MAG: hypothetical protein QM813_16935 [Verrucomicrobiota bacterium]
MDLPPLPAGFSLDKSQMTVPPLPEGFTLNSAPLAKNEVGRPLSWNPLKWDWSLSKNDVAEAGRNLKTGLATVGKQAYKGANDSIGHLVLMPADFTTEVINRMTGRNDPSLGASFQQASDTAIAPPQNMLGKVTNIGAGFAVGAKIPGAPVVRAVPAATSAMQQTANIAREAGYKLPPSSIPNAGPIARLVEKVVGTKAVNAAVTPLNKAKTAANIAEELGLPAGTEINPETIGAVTSHAWESGYAPIENLGGEYKTLIDVIRKARENVKKFYKDYSRNATSEKLDMARAAQSEATNAENVLAGALKQSDNPQLYENYVKARQMIAKASDVERNLVESTGELKNSGLAREFGKGAPQSGAVEAAGRTAQAVPKAFNTAPLSLSMADKAAGMGAVAGGLGTALMHNPNFLKYGAGLLALRLGQTGMNAGLRKALTSEWAQDAMVLMTPEQKRAAVAEALARTSPGLSQAN